MKLSGSTMKLCLCEEEVACLLRLSGEMETLVEKKKYRVTSEKRVRNTTEFEMEDTYRKRWVCTGS